MPLCPRASGQAETLPEIFIASPPSWQQRPPQTWLEGCCLVFLAGFPSGATRGGVPVLSTMLDALLLLLLLLLHRWALSPSLLVASGDAEFIGFFNEFFPTVVLGELFRATAPLLYIYTNQRLQPCTDTQAKVVGFVVFYFYFYFIGNKTPRCLQFMPRGGTVRRRRVGMQAPADRSAAESLVLSQYFGWDVGREFWGWGLLWVRSAGLPCSCVGSEDEAPRVYPAGSRSRAAPCSHVVP